MPLGLLDVGGGDQSNICFVIAHKRNVAVVTKFLRQITKNFPTLPSFIALAFHDELKD